jgi:hypothetical protein
MAIPAESRHARLAHDVLASYKTQPDDWRATW